MPHLTVLKTVWEMGFYKYIAPMELKFGAVRADADIRGKHKVRPKRQIMKEALAGDEVA